MFYIETLVKKVYNKQKRKQQMRYEIRFISLLLMSFSERSF